MRQWHADTSVVIPAVLASHEAHEAVVAALGRRSIRLPLHASIESYSVLTRLPGDARLTPPDAAHLLAARFGEPIGLPDHAATSVIGEFAQLGIAGGAVYDALIAMTARAAAATLLTRDRRAAATYELLHVAYQLVN